MKPIPTTKLPSGETVPVLGQGTWFMGEQAKRAADEATALRIGLDLGMTLIDTAEMYGSGGAEEVVADAIAGRRDEVFLVSKVLPENATRRGTIAACERSLGRLGTDRIDLYLLHWRGSPALADTLSAFETLINDGKIRHWGVSNFDTDDMEEMLELPGGDKCAANQVLYDLTRRGLIRSRPVLPQAPHSNHGVFADRQGRMLGHAALKAVGARHNATPAQIALAWLIRQDGMIAIPKAASEQHLRENRAAVNIVLSAEDLAELDKAFPPPKRKRSLEML